MASHQRPAPEIGICYGCHRRVLLNEKRLCMMCASVGGPLRIGRRARP
jgi:hypothetical protein